MKLKKFLAALEERPWLRKSIGQITGTHPHTVSESGGSWEKHLERWSLRNISEITVRDFKELCLDHKAEFIRYPFGPPTEVMNRPDGFTVRRYEAFIHTEFHIFNRSTYEDGRLDPFSFCWRSSSIYSEEPAQTVRYCIRHQCQPHYPLGTKDEIKVPYIFDAVVRITKTGVVGRCGSTIIDVFHFPADFDPESV